MSKPEKYWDVSWNPLKDSRGGYHCTKISPGCLYCWAEQLNRRFYKGQPYDDTPVEFVIDDKILIKPYHWKKPRIIFVCDMMDIFHRNIISFLRANIIIGIENNPRHIFLILTKRPENIEYLYIWKNEPPDNLWLGVTVCNQKEADEKIPLLLNIPAKHKWLSIEPLLSEIRIKTLKGIDWVVVGAESLGNRAGRECKTEWIEDIVWQCKNSDVPVFVKQIHLNGKLSKNISEWPESLRLRHRPF